MRKIKFRAWDKKENKWLLGYEMPNLGGFSMFGEIMMMGEYANLLSSYFPDRLEDIELMQYTGLKDKNGKEIYEGDILKHLDGRLSVVEYDAPHFILRHHPEGGSDFIAVKNHFEIIGNIYENPELLTNQK